MAFRTGSSAADTLTGTESADQIRGMGGYDTLYGLGGDDFIEGGDGGDVIYGGDNNDTLVGDAIAIDPSKAGLNTIHGGIGDDRIWGGVLGDNLFGDDGNDAFFVQGTSGAANYDGGADTDTIYILDYAGFNPAGSSHVTLYISSLTSIENIVNSTSKAAHIVSDGGTLNLSRTNLLDITLIRGGNDADNITGNYIFDTATNKYKGATIQGNGGDDTLTGSALGDFLYGGNGDDVLVGGSGKDTLSGDSGKDHLAGQFGDDNLIGGANEDLFYFNLGGGIDTIEDFQNGVDKIVVGADIENVGAFPYQGSAALKLTGSTAETTYVFMTGIDISEIDRSDFIFL